MLQPIPVKPEWVFLILTATFSHPNLKFQGD